LALSYIKLVRELGAERWIRHHGEEFFERVFHPRNVEEIIHQNPALILNYIRMAREFGVKTQIARYKDSLLEEVLTPAYLNRELLNNPDNFIEVLRLAKAYKSKQIVHTLGQTLNFIWNQSYEGDVLLKLVPLESLPEIQWLALTTQDEKLNLAIEKILSTQHSS
jgi:hypothetical protein